MLLGHVGHFLLEDYPISALPLCLRMLNPSLHGGQSNDIFSMFLLRAMFLAHSKVEPSRNINCVGLQMIATELLQLLE